MDQASVVGIVFVLLMVLGLTALVVGIVLLLTKSSGDAEGGQCGACGYAVRGVSTFSCPECGADLREVGINQTAKKGSANMAFIVVGGAALLFVVMCCGGWLLFASGSNSAAVSAPATMKNATIEDTSGDMTDPEPVEIDSAEKHD